MNTHTKIHDTFSQRQSTLYYYPVEEKEEFNNKKVSSKKVKQKKNCKTLNNDFCSL